VTYLTLLLCEKSFSIKFNFFCDSHASLTVFISKTCCSFLSWCSSFSWTVPHSDMTSVKCVFWYDVIIFHHTGWYSVTKVYVGCSEHIGVLHVVRGHRLGSLLRVCQIIAGLLLLLWGGIAQGIPCTATISDLLGVPIWVHIIPDSSTTALWQLPAETPSSEVGETWWEVAVNFAYKVSLFVLCRLL
jgi:hypothetical protein